MSDYLNIKDAITFNARKTRAQHLLAEIMRELESSVSNLPLREVHECLFRLFMENGWCITNDEERSRIGLEPRDSQGWTMSEKLKRKEDLNNKMMLEYSKIIGYPHSIKNIEIPGTDN